VAAAIIAAMSKRFDLVPGSLPSAVVDEAKGLVPDHLPRVA
jgi:hypothetical protein